MPKLDCIKCNTEMYPKKNGVLCDKYWDRALSLVEGCTPVSEGCQNCWSAAISYRFQHEWKDGMSVTEATKGEGIAMEGINATN